MTGSVPRDVCVCVLVAAAIVVASWQLRVYYQVTVGRVTVLSIDRDGRTNQLPTPQRFVKTGYGMEAPRRYLDGITRQITHFMWDAEPPYRGGPGMRTRWVIEYGYNRLDPDRAAVLNFDSEGRRED